MRSLLLTASFPPAVGGVETLLYQTNRRLAEPPLVLAPALPPADDLKFGPGRAHSHLADDTLHRPERLDPTDDRLARRERIDPTDDRLARRHADLTDEAVGNPDRVDLAADISVRRVPVDLFGRLAYRPLWRLHPSLHYVQSFWRPALYAAATWRPRVIQAGHIYLAPLAWLLARRLKLPFVVYAYGQEVWRGGRPMGLNALDERLRGGGLRAANRVLVPGTFTAGLMADWQVVPARLVSVPYGADPRPIASPPTGMTLLTVARLIPRKGIDTVIRAMPSLPPMVEYRVVGGGPDEARLRHLAAAAGVAERVHFLGRLDDHALADEYRRCTIFALPARRTVDGDLEGYGLVYFEAAAWGRPVVAGRSGGEIDAVVDGETGVLVDGTSVEELTHTIRTLLADPARLETLGAAGRHRVETTHNWQAAAAVIDSALVDLARGTPLSPAGKSVRTTR